MGDLGKAEDVQPLGVLADDGESRRLGARIELDPDRLDVAPDPILEPDREGIHPVDDGPPPLQELPRPLLRAWHQWLLLLVDDEDAQGEPLCIGARKGLVTELALGLSCAMKTAATAPTNSLPSTMLTTGIADESVS